MNPTRFYSLILTSNTLRLDFESRKTYSTSTTQTGPKPNSSYLSWILSPTIFIITIPPQNPPWILRNHSIQVLSLWFPVVKSIYSWWLRLEGWAKEASNESICLHSLSLVWISNFLRFDRKKKQTGPYLCIWLCSLTLSFCVWTFILLIHFYMDAYHYTYWLGYSLFVWIYQ